MVWDPKTYGLGHSLRKAKNIEQINSRDRSLFKRRDYFNQGWGRKTSALVFDPGLKRMQWLWISKEEEEREDAECVKESNDSLDDGPT